MGDFDFGQFKDIFEYLQEKLASGGLLTPEEQKAYDLLIGFAGQGLNLTKTADFNSLYKAFNALADDATKAEFARLYGDNLFQDPNTGEIQFTRPGTIIEQAMRRGLSVNDGPVMALLSEGLKNYTKQVALNSFNAMTNSYAAMTPIRQQNIDAASRAGQIGGAGANRLAGVAGSAVSGARGGAGEGEGAGEPITIGGEGEGSDKPGFFDKYGAALITLLGTGLLGAGGYLGKKWLEGKDQKPQSNVTDLDRASEERPPGGGQDYPELQNQPDIPFYPRMDTQALSMGFGQPFQNDPFSTSSLYEDSMSQQPSQMWQMNPYQNPASSGGGGNFYSGNVGNPNSWSTWTPESNSTPQYGGENWASYGDSNAWSPSQWGDVSGGYWV